jgi:hypothetical protein
MSTVGPICHIPPKQPKTTTSPLEVPNIPIATDLPSLIRASNVMRQAIYNLTQNQIINNIHNTTNNNKSSAGGRWQEKTRVSEKVRVFNPNDHTQYVDIERINALTMVDGKTGLTWNWRR